MPVKKLTASVVGCGRGGRLSLQALAESEFYTPLAAADLRPEVGDELQKKFPGLRIFADFRKMFATCPTDVVCVSTYPPTHEEIAVAALKRPLGAILVEKPIADTVASGRRILDFVRQSWIPLAVPHGLMVKRCPLEIIERVGSGEIGDLKLVEIQSPNFDIMSAGIHWLQFSISLNANHSVGSVLAACDKTTRTFRDGMKVETVAVTSVQMVNGVRFSRPSRRSRSLPAAWLAHVPRRPSFRPRSRACPGRPRRALLGSQAPCIQSRPPGG
jgi:predicted dehydrogenase